MTSTLGVYSSCLWIKHIKDKLLKTDADAEYAAVIEIDLADFKDVADMIDV